MKLILRSQFELATCILFLLCKATLAGISGSPVSYFIPTDDNKHILVLLALVPTKDDTKELAKLPNGQTVHLRSVFPQSGLYAVGSNAPIWTIDWHDGFCFLSPNTRYLVRVRDFGDFDHPNDEDSGWAIKFYTDGKLTKQYGVDELLDYPSLLPYWYRSILRDDYVDGDLEIRDGIFALHTFTHERYLFDITTGEVVEEFRLWKTTSRYVIGVLVVAAVAISYLLIQRVRKRNLPAGEEPVLRPKKGVRGSQKGLFSFSLRSMLLVTTVVAILCFVFSVAPHVAVLLTCFLTSIVFTIVTLRIRHHLDLRPTNLRMVLFNWMPVTLTLASWFSCYALSLAPTMGVLQALDAPHDVRMVVARVPYAPVYFILTSTSLETNKTVENYFGDWGA